MNGYEEEAARAVAAQEAWKEMAVNVAVATFWPVDAVLSWLSPVAGEAAVAVVEAVAARVADWMVGLDLSAIHPPTLTNLLTEAVTAAVVAASPAVAELVAGHEEELAEVIRAAIGEVVVTE